jgi:hypothetical protein
MLKILLITIILLIIAFAGLGIRLLLDRNVEFSGGYCRAGNIPNERNLTCGCGGGYCMAEKGKSSKE